MKRSCVHIVQPEGKLIPFETFNLLYRDGLAGTLEQRRAEFLRAYESGSLSAAEGDFA